MLRYLLLFCLLPLTLFSSKPTICLNMIVKDEAPVICRCLDSVKEYIDYWVIVDTGSSDGTQEIIRKHMESIPGELHERPWVDFAHNRNEALQLAKKKGDFLLLIDADEVMNLKNPTFFEKLEKDYYYATITQNSFEGQRICLINTDQNWFWKGVIHETLDCFDLVHGEYQTGVVISADANDGHRSQDPDKVRKDALVLEKALEKEPDSTKYTQYLAQCYYACDELELALKYYAKRAEMGGSEEEVFFSMYQVGVIQERLKYEPKVFLESFEKAYAFRPTRAEPLFHIARYWLMAGKFDKAYEIAQKGSKLPYPDDINQVAANIYDYGMLSLLADSAYYLGKFEESKEIYTHVLGNERITPALREAAEKMIQMSEANLPHSSIPY